MWAGERCRCTPCKFMHQCDACGRKDHHDLKACKLGQFQSFSLEEVKSSAFSVQPSPKAIKIVRIGNWIFVRSFSSWSTERAIWLMCLRPGQQAADLAKLVFEKKVVWVVVVYSLCQWRLDWGYRFIYRVQTHNHECSADWQQHSWFSLLVKHSSHCWLLKDEDMTFLPASRSIEKSKGSLLGEWDCGYLTSEDHLSSAGASSISINRRM